MSIDAYIKNARRDFSVDGLSSDLPDNPMDLLKVWIADAVDAKIVDANAFTLSTIDAHNYPQSRVVLLRGLTDTGIVFYTNYNSEKGKEIELNPKAGANFFWPDLNRQIRLSGAINKISKEESIAYFMSRPRESRLAAWASDQSEIIPSRQFLEDKFSKVKLSFKDKEVGKPDHWGGYLITFNKVEFWLGRPNRMHDRVQYNIENDLWTHHILSP